MSEPDKDINYSALADIRLAGHTKGLSARIQEIEFTWNTGNIKAEGTFCYLAFKDGIPTQDEFVDFIYHKIIPFCLPRSYIRENHEKLLKTSDEQYYFKLVDAAKSLFIKANNKNPKSGEPGEVVLFTLLEGLIGAPRIVSKMSLKTNSNMEVFGSDSIHIKYDQSTECLNLYWGEAKLYSDLSSALAQIAQSIKTFREYNERIQGIQRDFDIQLIKTHPDLDPNTTPEAIEALSVYLDPYSNYYNKIREIHACLAVWDLELYKNLASKETEEVERMFCDNYREYLESACSLFIKNVKNKAIDKFRFHFILLPIVNVYGFRKSFCAKVGLPFGDKPETINE